MGKIAIYCCATPFHILCAKAAIASSDKSVEPRFIHYGQPAANSIDLTWRSIQINQPKFTRNPGKSIIENLESLDRLVSEDTVVSLNSPVYDTETTNYFIHNLLKKFPNLQINIIQDGILNLTLHPLRWNKKVTNSFRFMRRFQHPRLVYTNYSGCRTGAEADFVNHIYLFDSFQSEYDQAQVRYVSLVRAVESENRKKGSETSNGCKALVLGQPFDFSDEASSKSIKKITATLSQVSRKSGKADYLPHPRDTKNCLWDGTATIISVDDVFEKHIVEHPYPLILGFNSTALVTAKMLLGSSARVVAVGLNLWRPKKKKDREALIKCFSAIGVEMLDVA